MTNRQTLFSHLTVFGLTACVILGAATSPARALLMTVSGPNSTAGTAAEIIAAPASAQNSMLAHTGQLGFDEAQNVLLLSALDTDDGVGAIAAGTTVSSHMIFLNQEDGTAGSLFHLGVEWTFNQRIIGVMSDAAGDLEAASTPVLGAIGTTTYEAPFDLRGLEGNDGTGLTNDGYEIIDPFTLRVGMIVAQPGDWIRVVTVVPVPGAVWMFLTAMAGLFGFGWVRRRNAVTA